MCCCATTRTGTRRTTGTVRSTHRWLQARAPGHTRLPVRTPSVHAGAFTRRGGTLAERGTHAGRGQSQARGPRTSTHVHTQASPTKVRSDRIFPEGRALEDAQAPADDSHQGARGGTHHHREARTQRATCRHSPPRQVCVHPSLAKLDAYDTHAGLCGHTPSSFLSLPQVTGQRVGPPPQAYTHTLQIEKLLLLPQIKKKKKNLCKESGSPGRKESPRQGMGD